MPDAAVARKRVVIDVRRMFASKVWRSDLSLKSEMQMQDMCCERMLLRDFWISKGCQFLGLLLAFCK